ncbi:FAD-binding protein [candidate division KSB1 bacterium]|nr:FAD-binding protein [candidate division KSB1 bacterium]
MVPKNLLKKLVKICGRENVLYSPTDLYLYEYDASMERGKPDVVVFVTSAQDIQNVVRLAVAENIPYTPRGSATNLAGGSVTPKGGIVIETARMNRILEIDEENGVAVVEPGLYNLQLQNELASRGFVFAPDPASQKVSTLGGNVGMNAGGPHCLKYGVTVNHVLGLEMVLPDGEIARFGGYTQETPGYDIVGFMNGSEGTLGIFTKLFLKMMPAPGGVETLLADFDGIEQAAGAVSAIIAAGIVPATLEYMDQTCIKTVVASLNVDYPTSAAAVLIIEVDGPQWSLAPQVTAIEKILKKLGARVRSARDNTERDALWAGRRGALGAMTRLKPSVVVFDGTVPRNKLPLVLVQIDDIAREYGLFYGTLLHAGDGNIHPIILYDERDEEETQRVHEGCDRIMQLCVNEGGTITGEHGVGIEKIPAMKYLFGEDELEVMKQLKDVFDPQGLCNPGKVLPA